MPTRSPRNTRNKGQQLYYQLNSQVNLASAGRMAGHRGIFKIKMVHRLGQIVGVLIHIVPLPNLARTSVAATIMGDDTITLLPEKQHWCVQASALKGPPRENVTTGPLSQSL